MKLLTFQATRFRWKTFSKTLPEVPDLDLEDEVTEAVVAFLHIEQRDEDESRKTSVFNQTLKHLKWIANKRGLKNVVLHSFTHLGGTNAEAGFAQAFMNDLGDRLEKTGYQVKKTPFGYFCSWDLGVYGDSLAKVWKEI
ncbi:MAG: threonyl-tRNA synthetase editing domain-containing protein [Byssovorax sp.]